MAGTNEILPYGLGVGSNVMSQSAWAASGSRTGGVTNGVADATLYNKAQRQAAFMARVLSQWAVDQTGGSILDNGDEANGKTLLTQTVQGIISSALSAAAYATISQMNAGDNSLLSQLQAEIATRASQDGALQASFLANIAAEGTARNNADIAEANARATVDGQIWAQFANYMVRGICGGNNLAQNFTPGPNWSPHNDMTTPSFGTSGLLMIVAASNLANPGAQPGAGTQQIWVDGVLLVSQQSTGSMTTPYVRVVGAGVHSIAHTYTTPNIAGTYSQMDMYTSWLFVGT